MKKSILIYGCIIGVILAINLVFMVNLLYNNPNMESNDVVGYAAMIIVFSLIFFGVRNYRNKQGEGFISFKEAFKMGAAIAFIAATMYVISWVFYYYLFVPDFMDKYAEYVLSSSEKKGATAATLAEQAKDMESFKHMYKNPLFVVLITYSEVLPVGLITALISALILKKKTSNQPNGLITNT